MPCFRMLSKAMMLPSMLHRFRGTPLLKEMDLWTSMHMLGLSKRLQHSMIKVAVSTPLCMLSSFKRPIMMKSTMIHLRSTTNPFDLSLCMLLLDECTRTAAQHYPRLFGNPLHRKTKFHGTKCQMRPRKQLCLCTSMMTCLLFNLLFPSLLPPPNAT